MTARSRIIRPVQGNPVRVRAIRYPHGGAGIEFSELQPGEPGSNVASVVENSRTALPASRLDELITILVALRDEFGSKAAAPDAAPALAEDF